MTVVRKHSCTEDRSGQLGDRKGSTECSKYDVLAASGVAFRNRNEERQMFGRVS
jgi:hypothetical protein